MKNFQKLLFGGLVTVMLIGFFGCSSEDDPEPLSKAMDLRLEITFTGDLQDIVGSLVIVGSNDRTGDISIPFSINEPTDAQWLAGDDLTGYGFTFDTNPQKITVTSQKKLTRYSVIFGAGGPGMEVEEGKQTTVEAKLFLDNQLEISEEILIVQGNSKPQQIVFSNHQN